MAIRTDSAKFTPIRVETGTDTAERSPKHANTAETAAEMDSGCHSSASCGLVRGKKKKEKEEEDEKTQKNGWKKNKGM